ncbi:MAG: Ni/Fe-hydrogenase, b-type cytochrome subunit [Brooklawnia sp.]|jgi:Ni/Fe-hydrogenase b-type cytochrome subunit
MSTDTAPPQVEIGPPISGSEISSRRVGLLAAITSAASDDPVDQALGAHVHPDDTELPFIHVDDGQVDPARQDRRYQLATVRDYVDSSGRTKDVVVMRGDLEAVLDATKAPRNIRALNRRNAQMVAQRGYRSLAVATAPLAADGSLGEYTVYGIVPVRVAAPGDFQQDAAARPGEWVRVNLWTGLLRVQHWANVVAVFVLSCTGYYIMDPFFGPWHHDGIETGYFMGWVRMIHFVTAFLWLGIGLTRLVLLFISRDRYLRWRALWPLYNKEDVRNMGRTAQYYLFLRKDAPLYLAHNPLQQLTYTAVYVVGILQMAIGFSIYAVYHMDNPFWRLVATPANWVGLPNLRIAHTMIMFMLWAFVIAHIYLAVRADSIERHGGLSSMLNGGVWLRRGSRPVDAPEVE